MIDMYIVLIINFFLSLPHADGISYSYLYATSLDYDFLEMRMNGDYISVTTNK